MSENARWLNPHKLAVFAKVAELGNITQAAAQMYMTQPAVSNIIRQLEDYYAVKLLEVQGKKVVICEAGRALVDEWKSLRLQYQKIDDVMAERREGEIGEVRLVMVSTAKYFMPQIISDFIDSYPQLSFRCHIAHRTECLEAILANQYDIGLVTDPGHHPAILAARARRNNLVFVANPQHPLAKRRHITIQTLLQQTFIVREQTALITQRLYQLFQQHHTVPDIRFEIDNTEGLKEAVIANCGLTLLPLDSVRREIKNKLVVELKTDPEKDLFNYWYVIKRRQHVLSQATNNFFQSLFETLKK